MSSAFPAFSMIFRNPDVVWKSAVRPGSTKIVCSTLRFPVFLRGLSVFSYTKTNKEYPRPYIFCFAVNSLQNRTEINFNFLKGDATLFDGFKALNYNAIPSQAINVVADRVLNLNGAEYTAATSQVMFEGFSAGAFGGIIDGKRAVANIGINFPLSIQPEFDIHIFCWNQNEVVISKDLHYKDFEHYSLADLNATIANLQTPGFQCATTSTHALWAVFLQTAGVDMASGGNVWQHPATGKITTVVLSDLPIQ